MDYKKRFLFSNKVNAVILLSIIIILLIAFWFGGRKKWDLVSVTPETTTSSSLSKAYEEKLKENPDDPDLKYNLAYFYYRQNRFDEAEKLLLEILNSSYADAELIKKVSYNLGNSLFRLSEKNDDRLQSLELLRRSLDQYRSVIEHDKEQQRTGNFPLKTDKDAKHNYAVVKNRIKILLDQQEQQKEAQQREKEIFVLLKELVEEEKQIKMQLQALQSSANSSSQSREQGHSLLKKRAENLELLKVVKERIKRMIQSEKQRSSASPVI